MKLILSGILFVLLFQFNVSAQYTLWATGNTNDTITSPKPCTLLMGGATEDDQAMTRFLQYADHGDIVVIRTSGADGYNAYLYSDLGVQVNSVRTFLIPSVADANDSFVVQTVRKAEALWIAGGDQWTYVSNWKNTALNNAINYLVNVKHVPIGGTSAGMAVMSEYYNSAQGGSAQSATVLANPYDATVTIGNSDFINNSFLQNTITDTHFDNPDRRGRLMTFIARTWNDKNVKINAIACDEYTSVFIDTNFKATVFGGKPGMDDNAYFVRIDCAGNNTIETCSSGMPLNWKQDSTVVKVYTIKSDSSGNQYFDLRNFGANPTYTNQGGSWLDWWVDNGDFKSKTGNAISCLSTALNDVDHMVFNVDASPNPFLNSIQLNLNLHQSDNIRIQLLDVKGHLVYDTREFQNFRSGYQTKTINLDSSLPSGTYLLHIQGLSGAHSNQILIRE